ncbi:MAG: hypothetical protein D3910_10500 [Candidatus Electrothrix sp. ATG2]|nr:hypothetical protein [Candidatus Electrothrix sp. ATG2]
MIASNTAEVLEIINTIISDAKADNSRHGYFAALYKQVTLQITQGIDEGRFADPARMDRLNTAFANRYFEAYKKFKKGQATRSWSVAFRHKKSQELIILQHLMLGINAHINLDLGIAVAELNLDELDSLKGDFDQLDDILESLLDEVQQVIGRFSPLLTFLDNIGGRVDETIVNFSIQKARRDAWDFAEQLAKQTQNERVRTICNIDKKTALLGRLIAEPGGVLGKAIDVIRFQECENVTEIIHALENPMH